MLYTEGVTIHWHGLDQQDNVWMDGVPYVTQYPTMPLQTFVYRFTATPAGTHWYHSHFSSQRLDGLFGMFLVHEAVPAEPYFAVSVMDWNHKSATSLRVTDPYNGVNRGPGDDYVDERYQDYIQDGVPITAVAWVSGIINGRGRMNEDKFPLEHFVVEKGRHCRFKVCHTGAEYPFELSIDLHQIVIRAIGGRDIEPVKADFLIIYQGECYDFEIEATGKKDKYWFRAKSLKDLRGKTYKVDQISAILQYGHSSIMEDAKTGERLCTATKHCTTFNCPFKGYADQMHRDCISVGSAKHVEPPPVVQDIDDLEPLVYFYNFAFSIGSSINSRHWISPIRPLFPGDTAAGAVTR